MRERHADRAGDDVHRADTLEEQASLSARFGLTITFLKPDRALYADIVCALADEYGVATPREALMAPPRLTPSDTGAQPPHRLTVHTDPKGQGIAGGLVRLCQARFV